MVHFLWIRLGFFSPINFLLLALRGTFASPTCSGHLSFKKNGFNILIFIILQKITLSRQTILYLKDKIANLVYSAGIYLLNNGNIRARCKFYSKITIKAAKQRQWCYCCVFIVNLEQILHIVMVFSLLTLSK